MRTKPVRRSALAIGGGKGAIADALATVRAIWQHMCRVDNIPADAIFVVFSEATMEKYGPFYNSALREFNARLAEYEGGGYVGLELS